MEYLTKHDFYALTSELPEPFLMVTPILKKILKNQQEANILLEEVEHLKQNILNQVQMGQDKELPEFFHKCPIDLEFHPKRNCLMGSFHLYALSLVVTIIKSLQSIDPRLNRNKILTKYEQFSKVPKEGLTETYIQNMKEWMMEIKKIINQYITTVIPELQEAEKYRTKQRMQQYENARICLIENRTALVWFYKNFERLMEAFNQPFPMDIYEKFDQDQFLVVCFHDAITEFVGGSYEEEEELDELVELEEDVYPFIKHYTLYYQHRKEVENYHPKYRYDLMERSVHVSAENLMKQQEEIEKFLQAEGIDFTDEEFDYPSKTFEELLETHLTDLKNRLEFEAFNKEILLGFELLPGSVGYGTVKSYTSKREGKTDKEKEAIEEKKERLLEEKLDIFKGKKVAEYQGINHFSGYKAFLYPNGRVILEKFYKTVQSKRKKNGKYEYTLEPVIDEAAYAMNMETFKQVAKMSKLEVRELRKTGVYPDITVLNHSKTFKQRVLAEMERPTGSTYSAELLAYIDERIEETKEAKREYQK